MKEELIDRLLEEIIKSKKSIKLSLMQVMDFLILETHNKYGRLVMTIEYTKTKEKEDDTNGQTKSN